MKQKAWSKGPSFFHSDQIAGTGSRKGTWAMRGRPIFLAVTFSTKFRQDSQIHFQNANKIDLLMGDPIFFSHRLLTLLRSRASARIGKRKEPPGRTKIATAGMIFAMFFRCLFISFFSSVVHFSSVFRIFIRSCISPFMARTSMRMASLFTRMSLLKYFFTIGTPSKTVVLSFVQGTGYHDIFCCQGKLYF